MLSSVSIVIPIYHLLSMFETGVDSVLSPGKKTLRKNDSIDKDFDSIDEDVPEMGKIPTLSKF